MHIRPATAADLPSITGIYNEVLLSSTAIYSDQPATLEDRTAWWQARCAAGYPVLVACEDHDGPVLGFASFGDFRSWPGYRFSVEGTIHLRADARGHGRGRPLLDELVAQARALGKHTLIAGVDSENTASLHFLARYGFREAGRLREVGFKFNRFLDLVLLQYPLSTPAPPPAAANTSTSS